MVHIVCDIPDDMDEKGVGGLWDLSGSIYYACANAKNDDEAEYAIYKILRNLKTK